MIFFLQSLVKLTVGGGRLIWMSAQFDKSWLVASDGDALYATGNTAYYLELS